MHCPTLKELPSPPKGKTGWPWTQESLQLPVAMPDGSPWPKVSIITPNYNFGQFIEETIRSVLLQGYPDLEYIIIDGGSTDDSVEIIRKYEKWLTRWLSEKDNGSANALNKGIRMISGDIFNWINSDDLLTPNCLAKVAALWSNQPQSMICGYCMIFDKDGDKKIIKNANLSVENFLFHWTRNILYVQPAVWVPMISVNKAGQFSESIYYTFDWDWMIRVVENCPIVYTSDILAKYRIHPSSKTVLYDEVKKDEELRKISEKYLRQPCWRNSFVKFKKHYDMVDWCDEVCRIRAYGCGRFKTAALILIKSLSNYRRLINRFTWGALKETLFQVKFNPQQLIHKI